MMAVHYHVVVIYIYIFTLVIQHFAYSFVNTVFSLLVRLDQSLNDCEEH